MRPTIDPATTYRLMVTTTQGREALFLSADSPHFRCESPEDWFRSIMGRWAQTVEDRRGDGTFMVEHLSGASAFRLAAITSLWFDHLGTLLTSQCAVAAIFQAASAPHPDQSGKA